MTDDSPWIRDPAAFNAKAYALATERRHAAAPDDLVVTATTHPALFAVLEVISHDSGASAGHSSYCVPARYRAGADRAEPVLAALSSEERETVACGDRDEAAEVLTRRVPDAPAWAELDALLDAFFEDWHEEPESGPQQEGVS